jgi:predicted nuclease of predicted toxin-antitoxin system
VRFVIDEDMPRSTGRVLQSQGHEVKDIRDHGLRGANEEAIFRFAQTNRSVLITGDLGFGNILHFPIGSHFGIVVIRFPNEMATGEMNRQLVERLRELSDDQFTGHLLSSNRARSGSGKSNNKLVEEIKIRAAS